MGSRKGTTNNPDHERNLTHFTSETARAAARKSAEVRRQRKAEQAAAAAAAKRDIQEWVDTYEREQLGESCAAAAQKIAHMILDGEITDQRALVAALPVLSDIARLEAGQHTAATLHATISDPAARLAALRGQAADVTSVSQPPALPN